MCQTRKLTCLVSSFLPDWYFWFPLYVLAAAINLLRLNFRWRAIAQSAMLVLCGGISLLIKVLVEAHLYGLCGFWSMDMRERVVREKIGSGLVAISMLCILITAAASQEPLRERKAQDRNYVASGKCIPFQNLARNWKATIMINLFFCRGIWADFAVMFLSGNATMVALTFAVSLYFFVFVGRDMNLK